MGVDAGKYHGAESRISIRHDLHQMTSLLKFDLHVSQSRF
jgi:hypothetical protein